MKLLCLLLLVGAAWALEDISCFVTSISDTSNVARNPSVKVQMRIPGTWTVTGYSETETYHFYHSAFHLYNASNSVRLYAVEGGMVPSTSLGVTTLTWDLRYPSTIIGDVKIKYTRLPFQSVNFLFNGTAVNSLDLTCPTKQLTQLYAGTIVGDNVVLMANKPIKRCDSNTTSSIPASWFTYSTHTCTNNVPGCTYFNMGSICATSHLIPTDSTRMYWYCTKSANFSSDLNYLRYSVAAGVICDAADNHTVSHRGASSGDSLFLEITNGLRDGNELQAMSIPVSESLAHDEIIVDVMYPVVFSNFSAIKTYVAVTHSSSLFVERCIVERALTATLIVYQCPLAFTPWPRTSPTFIAVGPKYVHSFPGIGVETTYENDDELDTGDSSYFSHAVHIRDAYRLSANQVLLRATHTLPDLPHQSNVKVYLDKVYNASNITRASPSSFYANFDTTNALPDSSKLYTYVFPYVPYGSDEAFLYSTAVKVTDGAPDDTEDITFDDLDGPYKAAAYIGLATSGIVALAILYYGYHNCMPNSKGYQRARS